ncbi:hypothetical protein KPH14_005079 [Odynerus spinipes]|uniref:Uncharacterized protein n=1 Tax=Odynerus spinipes TaxID=1348599 RepID=A0AAD9RL08_9HYME|nr:hypothetical protein KPH14_005079 [Odynerus spinipes]
MGDKNTLTSTNNIGGSNECSVKARVDSLIREFLEESIVDKKCQQQCLSWRSQDIKLSASNWSKETTYNDLQRKIKFLKETILKYTTNDQIRKQKLGNLQMQRAQEEQKDWDYVQLVIATHDKNFSYAQIEYSIQNLTKDIKNYCQEYTMLCEKIVDMKSKLNNLTMQYNMDWIESNSDFSNLYSVINSIKSKNTCLLSATRSAEDTLQELKNKKYFLKKILSGV